MEAYQRNKGDPDKVSVRPNTASYTIAMNAWGIVAAQKARKYKINMKRRKLRKFNELDQLHDESTRRNTSLTSKQKYKRENDIAEIKNNFENGYEEVLNAEAILAYMHDLHDAGHPGVNPDTTSYNCLIKC